MNSITPAQSRAARGLVDWSQAELAGRSNLSESTIRDFEKGRRVPSVNNLAAIQRALETAGVEFTNGGQPGVRMRRVFKTQQEILEMITDALRKAGFVSARPLGLTKYNDSSLSCDWDLTSISFGEDGEQSVVMALKAIIPRLQADYALRI